MDRHGWRCAPAAAMWYNVGQGRQQQPVKMDV